MKAFFGVVGKKTAAEMEAKSNNDKDGTDRPSKRQCFNGDAELRPLLEQLRYGKVIEAVSKIRELTEEAMKKIGEEMILPRIIVIGNESSGKSSTLERIAGQPVLPCADGICTRAPVVLELKYDPGAVMAKIFFKGFDGGYVHMSNAEEARKKVQAAMESLKSVGIAPDKEVRVKIVSQNVPTLELVDLPGLVLARNNLGDNKDPDNISALTEECAKKYLESSNTAVVLCIVSASEPNLRTVMALKLLQDCRNYETLKESVIGVFAQSDKTYDSSWRDEGQPGPRWRLEERLLGTAKDQVHVVNGYVAVKNRNTRSQNAQNEDLTGCWSNEIKWFEEEADLSEQAKMQLSDRLGLCALLKKIDKVFCKHLNDHWVPKEMAAIDKERKQFETSLQEIRKSLHQVESSQLLEHMRARLAVIFIDPCLEQLSRTYVGIIIRDAECAHNATLIGRIQAWEKLSAAVNQYATEAPDYFIQEFQRLIEKEFQRDAYPYEDLKPFKSLWSDSSSVVGRALAVFIQEQAKKLQATFKDEMRLHKGAFIAGYHPPNCPTTCLEEHLRRTVRAILLEHFLLPCVGPTAHEQTVDAPKLPWLSRCADSLQQEGAKHFKNQEESLLIKKEKCDQVKIILTKLLPC